MVQNTFNRYLRRNFNFVKEKLQIDIEQGTILDLQFAENSFDLVCARH